MPARHDLVLVPTDFSGGANLALRRALRLPLAPRARVVALHVVRRASPAAETTARAALATLAAEAAVPEGVELVTELVVGEPFEQIITHARGLQADLVVIGRHGHRQLRQVMLGTTAERTIRYGDTPVLVVNRDGAGPYRRPLVATGLDDDARRIAELALGVLEAGLEPGFEIALVHAYRVAFEELQPAPRHGPLEHELEMEARGAMEKLLATLETEGVRWKPVIRRGDARTVISSEILAIDADLVVVGTHGRAGLAHVLVGSIAEWVIATALCDVLVGRPTRFTFALP